MLPGRKEITILCSALQSSLQYSPLSYIYIARMNPPMHYTTNKMGRFKKNRSSTMQTSRESACQSLRVASQDSA